MKNNAIELSIVIPVYNRPFEIDELLKSLTQQTRKNFEVIIVEDGSIKRCDEIVDKYRGFLNIRFFYKNNTGPGQSRNYGYEKAKGNYCVFLDSDCILPVHYIEIVQNALMSNFVDAFGGPDKAHENFTHFQKAINYAMTSFLTTGGIRGGKKRLDEFYPRSFNMGCSKKVLEETKGFSNMRFGEDIDISIRIIKRGFKTGLINEAFVYHKRRTSLKQFFKQVYNSGIARINLFKRHPESLKIIHTLPSLFIIGIAFLSVLSILVSVFYLIPVLLFTLLLFCDSSFKNRSISIGMLTILVSFTQLFGYGSGFMVAFWKRILLEKDEFSAFTNNFYT